LYLILSLPVCFAEEINLITDANGNLAYDGEFYREYNGFNQLVRIYNGSDSNAPLLQEFEFDPVEERIVKKVTYFPDGNPRETIIYFSQDFVRVDYHNGTVRDTEYVYLDGQLVAQVTGDETLLIHGNHEGSSSVVTDENGEVVENTSYSPFGTIMSGGTETLYDYTSEEFDTISGDYDYNKRRYDSEYAQFLSPDPVIQNAMDPQFLNHYVYVRNNPYKFIDPDGKNVRVYVNRDSANLGFLGAQGHIVVAVDDPNNVNIEILFENKGIGSDQKGESFGIELNSEDTIERYIMSFTGEYEAATEEYEKEVRNENGEIILPENYDDYYEIEQNEETDWDMIKKGLDLTSNPWYYHATSQSSLDYANEILSAGRNPLVGMDSPLGNRPNSVFKMSKHYYSNKPAPLGYYWKSRIGNGGIIRRLNT
jgi:RHS repeat-associated protein